MANPVDTSSSPCSSQKSANDDLVELVIPLGQSTSRGVTFARTCFNATNFLSGTWTGAAVVSHKPLGQGSFTSTGLVVSSTLPRFSDVYTLTIASADPKSISANKPVKLSKSVTKWFTKDGILVEGLFWKDIEGLIDNYKGDHKNKMESEPLLASHPGSSQVQ